jgi:hypothetical protein
MVKFRYLCNYFSIPSSYQRKVFLMKPKTYLRLFLVVLMVSSALLLFSYNKSKASDNSTKECTDDGKCQKKGQTEYILWESISHDIFGVNG